jgi:hypothetical protein
MLADEARHTDHPHHHLERADSDTLQRPYTAVSRDHQQLYASTLLNWFDVILL